jgi:ubiquinone biosynthesis protein
MEYVSGQKITSLNPVVFVDVDGNALADELFRAYLRQVIVDGFFHADPHPGNVFLTDDGRLALLDLGMVNRLSATKQEQLLKLLIAVADGRGEQAAEVVVQMGRPLDGFDEPALARSVCDLVAKYQGASIKNLHVGAVMLQMARVGSQRGLQLPGELTLLGKTLLNLDEIGRRLAPDFDVHESLRRNAAELMRERMRRSFSLGGALNSALEMKEFLEALPVRLNRVVENVSNNNLKLKLEVIDQQGLIDGFQKIANRIALGLLLAALIVGAALLMQVRSSLTLFGYPALAMAFFLMAAGGGAWLAVHIIRNDGPRAKRP